MLFFAVGASHLFFYDKFENPVCELEDSLYFVSASHYANYSTYGFGLQDLN